MGTSRKFVDRLQRSMTRAETKPAASPAETPRPATAAQPAGSPQDDPLRPEQLSTLREIVREEQLHPFTQFAPGPAAASIPEAVPPAPEPPHDPAPQHVLTPAEIWKEDNVSNIETVLKEAMAIDGAIGVALVDYTSGMSLGQAGGGTLNLDVAAAGNTEVVRAKLRTMEALGMSDGIEDILITLSSQYHLIRLINGKAGMGLFLYLALDKSKANLALARHKLSNLESQLEV